MWFSVDKLAKLPPETTFFCGHEYTEANGTFCLTIEPENELLQQRVEEIRELRAKGLPTVPSTILDELTTNVFLRANDTDLKESLGMACAEDWEVFAEIRTPQGQGVTSLLMKRQEAPSSALSCKTFTM